MPTRWVGIDEAGYGPNLGPMVMAAVAAEGPDGPEPDLWADLAGTVCRAGDPGGRLWVDDSKALYKGGVGRDRLEAACLAAVAAATGRRPTSLGALLDALGSGTLADVELTPWLDPGVDPLLGSGDGTNPIPGAPGRNAGDGTNPMSDNPGRRSPDDKTNPISAADPTRTSGGETNPIPGASRRQTHGDGTNPISGAVRRQTHGDGTNPIPGDPRQPGRRRETNPNSDADPPPDPNDGTNPNSADNPLPGPGDGTNSFSGAPWRLVAVRAVVVGPGRFNAGLDRLGGNKARVHFEAFARLLGGFWQDAEDGIFTKVRGDKHGGRHFYAGPLSDAFPDAWLARGPEGPLLSRYTLTAGGRRLELSLTPHADAGDGLVALASVVSKAVREAWMDAFNAHWTARVPGLRPTAGYPGDAGRFREAIGPLCEARGLDPSLWWREK